MRNLIKARAILPPQREDTLRREFTRFGTIFT